MAMLVNFAFLVPHATMKGLAKLTCRESSARVSVDHAPDLAANLLVGPALTEDPGI